MHTNSDPKRCTKGRSLQVPLKKCPAGSGLQVAFKSDRPIFILERGRRSDLPRTKLRCMWDFSGIMVLQSILQVLRLACVNLLRLRKRLQRIHVVISVHGVSPPPFLNDKKLRRAAFTCHSIISVPILVGSGLPAVARCRLRAKAGGKRW